MILKDIVSSIQEKINTIDKLLIEINDLEETLFKQADELLFNCDFCGIVLTQTNHGIIEDTLYCKDHFKEVRDELS